MTKDELNAEISARKDEQTKAETALDKANQAKMMPISKKRMPFLKIRLHRVI